METVYIILPEKCEGIKPKYSKQVINLIKWFQKYVSEDIKGVTFGNLETAKGRKYDNQRTKKAN